MSTAEAPTRLDQRMEALHRANEIRSNRARLKRDVRASRVQAVDIITEPPLWAGTMRAGELLGAISGVGPAKARVLMHRSAVPFTATLGSLTPRQREALVGNVGRREPRTYVPDGRPREWQPAMKVANMVRVERAALHREVAGLPLEERRERVAALLMEPPSCLTSMRVLDLLLWAGLVGPHRARRIMGVARVELSRTVEMTTFRQRRAVAACLTGSFDVVREDAEKREMALRAAA